MKHLLQSFMVSNFGQPKCIFKFLCCQSSASLSEDEYCVSTSIKALGLNSTALNGSDFDDLCTKTAPKSVRLASLTKSVSLPAT